MLAMYSQFGGQRPFLPQGKGPQKPLAPSQQPHTLNLHRNGEGEGENIQEALIPSEEEAQRISVLVNTDKLLDNPHFEAFHAGWHSAIIGSKVGLAIGLPMSLLMLTLNSLKLKNEGLRQLPEFLTKAFGETHLERVLDNAAKRYPMANNHLLKAVLKVGHGTAVSGLIGGLFFGPIVGSVMVANARSKLLNIKRSAKNEYNNYQPDFIDHHINHVHHTEDPVKEFNAIRQELTNPTDAAYNGFHTAIFVKLLTLGSKIGAAALLGGLFEMARYGLHYQEMQFNQKSLGASFSSEGGAKLMGISADGKGTLNQLGQVVTKNDDTKNLRYFQKLAQALDNKKMMEYVMLRMERSPITHLLTETGKHSVNMLMLANLFVTPAFVALKLIDYFTSDEIGMEHYQPKNPYGERWKHLLDKVKGKFHHKSTKAQPPTEAPQGVNTLKT